MSKTRIIIYSCLLGIVLIIALIQIQKPIWVADALDRIPGLNQFVAYERVMIANQSGTTSSATASSTNPDSDIDPADLASSATAGALDDQSVIALTNIERENTADLPPLTENADLDAAAKTKLNDMFARQYFAHVSPDGNGPAYLAEQAGYEYIVEGENLALGDFKNSQALLDAWMASPGHRANILNTRYTDIGVAVGEGMYDGQETWMAVQEFGRPLSLCPQVDAGLHSAITSNESQATQLNSVLATERKALALMSTSTPDQDDAYNQAVNHYNADVALYDGVISRLKAQIQTYNTQVDTFNACING